MRRPTPAPPEPEEITELDVEPDEGDDEITELDVEPEPEPEVIPPLGPWPTSTPAPALASSAPAPALASSAPAPATPAARVSSVPPEPVAARVSSVPPEPVAARVSSVPPAPVAARVSSVPPEPATPAARVSSVPPEPVAARVVLRAPEPVRPSSSPENARVTLLAPDGSQRAPVARPSSPAVARVTRTSIRPPLRGDDEGELAQGSTDRARAAGDALRSLARASRSYLIYDPANAAVRSFIEEVRAAFDRFFTQHGDLELAVRPFELLLDGEAVYVERDRERSLALKLFRDGVRRLTLTRDTDWTEITRLLEILSIRFVGVRLDEDDVVTLLWKAGFAHIRIEAVEGFVPDDEDTDTGPLGGARLSAEQIFGNQSTRIGDVASMRVPDDFDLPLPRLPAPVPVRFQPLDAEELHALQVESESMNLPEAALGLVHLLLDVALSPDDALDLASLEHMLREVRDFLLAEDRIEALLELYDALSRAADHSPDAKSTLANVLAGFVDLAAVRRIIRSVPKDAAEPPERLQHLLTRVPGDALAMLFELLDTERDDHTRRIVRQLIAQRLPLRTHAVVARFRTSAGPVAADLLRVLAHAVPEVAAQLVTSLMADSNTEVQHEFLRLSADMAPTAQLRALLTLMLDAAALDVRTHCLDTIAARGERGAFPTVLRHAESRAEAGASAAEMAAVGRALARIDATRAIEQFREWAAPRGLLGKLLNLRPQQLRAHAAVWGLAEIGTPEAHELLGLLHLRGDQELRDAARDAAAAQRDRGQP